jgi:hypothetical protein
MKAMQLLSCSNHDDDKPFKVLEIRSQGPSRRSSSWSPAVDGRKHSVEQFAFLKVSTVVAFLVVTVFLSPNTNIHAAASDNECHIVKCNLELRRWLPDIIVVRGLTTESCGYPIWSASVLRVCASTTIRLALRDSAFLQQHTSLGDWDT